MVRLEAISGREVFIHPARALAIEHAAQHGNSVVHVGTGINVVVKGTPDEVHAKLFPEMWTVKDLPADVVEVLEYVDQVANNRPVTIAPSIGELARKALGREGA